jgi:hypothetical protein
MKKEKNILRAYFSGYSMHPQNGAMKMRRHISRAIILLIILGSPIYSQGVTKVGTTAANFLAIDVGPRANGMGSAFVSVADDPTAMYWNPAGIAQISNLDTYFSSARWLADLSFNYAGIVLGFGDLGNLGVNATFLTMDKIEQTTILRPDGTGVFFDAASYAFGLTYARNLTDRFSIGLNAKYINERLYNESANGFALDVGALFDTQLYGLKLGMSISNYGTKMKMEGRDLTVQVDPDPSLSGNNPNINTGFQTDAYDLPIMFRVGMSMDVLKGIANSNFIVSADALHPSDDVESVNVGGEYIFNNMLALRIGYKGLFAKDSQQGLNYGGGINYTISDIRLHFDYSYIDFGVLKSVHMFSLGLGL